MIYTQRQMLSTADLIAKLFRARLCNVTESYIYIGHDNSFFKERSGREGMTVVSVLLGAAVAVGVGLNPTIAK